MTSANAPMTAAGGVLLVIVGAWLMLQAIGGRLAQRLLSFREFGADNDDLTTKHFGGKVSATGAKQLGGGGLVTAAGATLSGPAASSWKAMVDAANRKGVAIGVQSSYRTLAEQAKLRMDNGCPDVNTSPADTCRVPTAVPGQSDHNRGLAVDVELGGGSEAQQRAHPAYLWLAGNAAAFGWAETVKREPWHWAYRGPN